MDIQQVRVLYDYVKKMANVISSLRNDLEYMINGHLDVRNIRANGIEARNIKAGSITTDKIESGAVTADKIEAGAVTADKISVEELSAITANMGKLTSGEIYGAYIATDEGGYPRIEFSSDDNLLKALANEDQYISITPFDSNDVPSLNMIDTTGITQGVNFYLLNLAFHLIGIGATPINITANGSADLALSAAGSGYVSVNSWSKFLNRAANRTLQQELNDIWDAIDDLEDRVSALEGP